jgi:ubiquinone/menaquinone biosynthesis C-methylase UbiE
VEPDELSARLAEVFGRAAPTYDTVIPFFEVFGRRLVELAAPPPGSRVLDVACGRGASLLPAAEAVGPGGEVVGVDLSPEMVRCLTDEIQRRSLPNARALVGDAHNLDFDDGSFDLVVCGFTLMLFPDPTDAVRELLRVVRPGGLCALSQPRGAGQPWSFWADLVVQYEPLASDTVPPQPLPIDLDETARAAGFVGIRVIDETHHFRFPEPESWWEWAWSQGMRGFLESLPEGARDDLRAEAMARLAEVDGLDLDQRVRFVLARRPG